MLCREVYEVCEDFGRHDIRPEMLPLFMNLLNLLVDKAAHINQFLRQEFDISVVDLLRAFNNLIDLCFELLLLEESLSVAISKNFRTQTLRVVHR